MSKNIHNSRLAITALTTSAFAMIAVLCIALNKYYIRIGPILSSILLLSILVLIPTSIISGTLALYQIRKHRGRLVGRIHAISGIVLGISVILIIALLIGMGIRRSYKAAENARCRVNIECISRIKSMWASDNNQTDGQVVTWQDLAPYMSEGKQILCPSGGTYRLNPIGTNAECSIPEHKKHAQAKKEFNDKIISAGLKPLAFAMDRDVIADLWQLKWKNNSLEAVWLLKTTSSRQIIGGGTGSSLINQLIFDENIVDAKGMGGGNVWFVNDKPVRLPRPYGRITRREFQLSDTLIGKATFVITERIYFDDQSENEGVIFTFKFPNVPIPKKRVEEK